MSDGSLSFVAETFSVFTVLQQRDYDIPMVTLALPLVRLDRSVFLPLPLLQSQKRFLATSANKAFAINRPVRFSPLLRSGVGDLVKPDTKNGQDFRLAQSAQAISSSLFNLNTSQMSLIRS